MDTIYTDPVIPESRTTSAPAVGPNKTAGI